MTAAIADWLRSSFWCAAGPFNFFLLLLVVYLAIGAWRCWDRKP